MKFLDLNGLKHIWAKIVNKLVPYVNNLQDYLDDDENVPDVIDVSYQGSIYQNTTFDVIDVEMNIYNWFKDAPFGAILDIVSIVESGSLTCKDSTQSYLQKSNPTSDGTVRVNNIVLPIGAYIRVIKKSTTSAFSVNFKTILN